MHSEQTRFLPRGIVYNLNKWQEERWHDDSKKKKKEKIVARVALVLNLFYPLNTWSYTVEIPRKEADTNEFRARAMKANHCYYSLTIKTPRQQEQFSSLERLDSACRRTRVRKWMLLVLVLLLRVLFDPMRQAINRSIPSYACSTNGRTQENERQIDSDWEQITLSHRPQESKQAGDQRTESFLSKNLAAKNAEKKRTGDVAS